MTLLHLPLVDSTQSFLVRHLELGFCGVLADAQTAGRGRGANRWESAPGAGLWFSAALPVSPVPPGLVLQRAMGAVIEVLEPCGLELGLKWPNDLVAWREGRLVKLGGIIGEYKGDRMILGLGLNLSAAPEIPGRAIGPASLLELGARVLPPPVELARELREAWADLTVTRSPAFHWPQAGDRIRWEEDEGLCEGWAEDGQLKVRTAEGSRSLASADVEGLSRS